VLADGGVGAAQLLVEGLALVALELLELVLVAAAPGGLGPVEALVGPAVAALAAQEDVRPVRPGDVGPEQVEDLGLEAEGVAVVDQALEHPGGDDAAAAHHHQAGAALE